MVPLESCDSDDHDGTSFVVIPRLYHKIETLFGFSVILGAESKRRVCDETS